MADVLVRRQFGEGRAEPGGCGTVEKSGRFHSIGTGGVAGAAFLRRDGSCGIYLWLPIHRGRKLDLVYIHTCTGICRVSLVEGSSLIQADQ